ncbi:hypothetical protein V2J09_023526 [Rumex salicifolius]
MALQAVNQQGLYGHTNDPNTDFCNLLENRNWEFSFPNPADQDFTQELGLHLLPNQNPWELKLEEISPLSTMVPSFSNERGTPTPASNSPEQPNDHTTASILTTTRPKRRRYARKNKNKEETETQRMTHIAVERNRRKQMNEYLSTLKSMMPHSYVQRGDQASIVGAAMNFVKELEQNLHSLSTKKASPFADFFSFPQYSTMADSAVGCEAKRSAVADVEVFIVEGHANLKIRSRKHPKQLLKIVIGLHNLRLTILHLNVNTLDQFCLYSFNLKVEDDSKLKSKEEVATAVHQLLLRIQEEGKNKYDVETWNSKS